VLLSAGLLGACARPLPPGGYRTATSAWYGLNSESDRRIFTQGYNFGQGDAIKQTYWAQQRPPSNARGRYDWMGSENDQPKEPRLKRRLVNVPVPAHTDPDGTQIEAGSIVVEAVQ
jgi:hypothetical protein